MIVYTASRSSIVLDTIPLATAGGEGCVYRIINTVKYPNHCVKLFHDTKRSDKKKNKIIFMIANEPTNLSALPYHFCWPKEIVYDDYNKFIGFIMPLAAPNSEKLYELAALNLSSRLNAVWQKFDRRTETGIQNRIKICIQLAGAVHALHQSKLYTVVDLKPQNILITAEGKLSVTDIDSFQVFSGLGVYPGDVVTPEYAPAEFHSGKNTGQNVATSWDHFSLAVTVYEILLGLHPYTASSNETIVTAETISDKIKGGLFVHGANKHYLSVIPPPHNTFHSLPQPIRTLFHKAFENGHFNASERPSAEVWGATLYSQISKAVV
jgi:DNA-binding helix-hairpin-helix protein with protein kinase domain